MLLLSGLALGAPPAAAPPPPAELIARIDAAQRDLRTLSADFVQHSRVKLFRQQVSSYGRLQYQRDAPSRLRWDYLRPDPSTLLLSGERATLRLPGRPPQEFDTARDPNLRAVFTQLRLWLGQGSLHDAQSEYAVSSGGTAAQPALVLLPKPGSVLARTFARIELQVDGRSMQLVRLLLVESSGDEKEILFTHIERNAALPPNAFQ